MWIALLGCTDPGEPEDSADETELPADSDTGETGETGETGDTGETGETGDPTPSCPDGMVLVGADDDDAFCIFQYEASLGDDDEAWSVPGAEPLVGRSWYVAKEMCERRGWTLATSSQWEDAADGVIGEGGTNYPYGDDPDPDACVTPDLAGELQYGSLQLTGSLETCVSAWGAYDLSGNAFEWADPQLSIDVQGFLDRWTWLSEGDDGDLYTSDPERPMPLEVAGVNGDSVRVEEGGRVLVEISTQGWRWETGNATGYLTDPTDAESALPVEVVPIDTDYELATLRIRWDEDGSPRTDKRGGAWYAGTTESSKVHQQHLGHVPEFDGTISFRCVAEPQ